MSYPLIDSQLVRFGERGLIEPFHPDQVNPASYNLAIGSTAKIETPEGIVDLDLGAFSQEAPFLLEPHGWILTDVAEHVTIPSDHEAQVILRSSAARRGWDHALAGYVDPGYRGRLTLEFVNCLRHHALPIYPGLQLVQLRIYRLDEAPTADYSRTGRYCNATRVEGCKDDRL